MISSNKTNIMNFPSRIHYCQNERIAHGRKNIQTQEGHSLSNSNHILPPRRIERPLSYLSSSTKARASRRQTYQNHLRQRLRENESIKARGGLDTMVFDIMLNEHKEFMRKLRSEGQDFVPNPDEEEEEDEALLTEIYEEFLNNSPSSISRIQEDRTVTNEKVDLPNFNKLNDADSLKLAEEMESFETSEIEHYISLLNKEDLTDTGANSPNLQNS